MKLSRFWWGFSGGNHFGRRRIVSTTLGISFFQCLEYNTGKCIYIDDPTRTGLSFLQCLIAIMHIRLATPSDFSSTASMSVDSFWNDELYVYANPRREQYPDDFRDAFLRRHRLRYWLPDYIFQVAVTDPGDDDNDPGGRVVGHAIWIRNGSSEEARKWHTHSYWGCKGLQNNYV